jgi:Acetyltransferase (GNAT) domain
MQLNTEEEVYFSVLHGFPPRELEERWRDFLGRVEYPGAYHTPEFFLEPFWEGKHPFAILAFKQGEMVGVLTGLHLRHRILSGLPSRPQLFIKDDNGGVVTDTLLKGLLRETGPTKLVEVFSWHSTPLPTFEEYGFRKKQLEGNVVLDLRLGAEALFKQFHDSRRRNIRTAMKKGIEVSEVKTEEDLAAYWEVYCGWRGTGRKKVRADSSFAQVKKVHELSANHCRFLARYKGKPIAGSTVRFCPAGLIVYADNCSLEEFIRFYPNDLLIWKAIEWACKQGFPKMSLGGAHIFLRRCGGVVEPIDRYRLDRTFLHRHELKGNLLAIRTALFHVLPVPLQQVVRALRKRRVRPRAVEQ